MFCRRLSLLSVLLLAGCRTEMARTCVPPLVALAPRVDLSAPPGDPFLGELSILSVTKKSITAAAPSAGDEAHRRLNVLAMSGGGIYGAFDVGVLAGWSAAGTRPVFDVVTGISTGGLIATFAFLGPHYDAYLHDNYVNISSDDIYRTRRLLAILRSDSVASSVPLQRRIMEAITPAVLDEVAREHTLGRRLYIG